MHHRTADRREIILLEDNEMSVAFGTQSDLRVVRCLDD